MTALTLFGRDLARLITLTAVVGLMVDAGLGTLLADPVGWRLEWRRTDFSKHSVPLAEVKSGGPAKDGIPSIDMPRFEPLDRGRPAGWSAGLGDTEPVIALSIDEDARAYPLRVLIWHEIANDTVGRMPVTVTYCPLCNAALAFERVVDGRVRNDGKASALGSGDVRPPDRELVATVSRRSNCWGPDRETASADGVGGRVL